MSSSPSTTAQTALVEIKSSLEENGEGIFLDFGKVLFPPSRNSIIKVLSPD